jgi:hypothetical protein
VLTFSADVRFVVSLGRNPVSKVSKKSREGGGVCVDVKLMKLIKGRSRGHRINCLRPNLAVARGESSLSRYGFRLWLYWHPRERPLYTKSSCRRQSDDALF